VDCKRVEAELVSFQLAALDGATRAGVETHLIGCGRCVGQFLALKRAVDAGDDVIEGPSELARRRLLRSAGARATQLAAAATAPTSTMERRAAMESARDRRHAQRLYFAVAALLVAAMAPFAWQARHAVPAKRPVPSLAAPPAELQLPTEEVDTARLTPDNLRFL
jgi:hypothetical protein